MQKLWRNFAFSLYLILPKRLVNYIGKTKLLGKLREKLLRHNGSSKLITKRVKSATNISFLYTASIANVAKAKSVGIETDLLLKISEILNSDNNTILDVGASYGYLTLVLANSSAVKGKVIALEAHPDIARILNNNVEQNNLKNVACINTAVSDRNGEVELNLFHETSNVLRVYPNSYKSTIRISATTIDDIVKKENIKKVNLIKIDVDGYELNVLKGAENTIKENQPIIVCESNQNVDVARFLIDYGYKLYDIQGKSIEASLPLPHDIIAQPYKR